MEPAAPAVCRCGPDSVSRQPLKTKSTTSANDDDDDDDHDDDDRKSMFFKLLRFGGG